MNKAIEKVIETARAEVGYIEDAGNKCKYNRWYYGSDLSADWCGVFCEWLLDTSGLGYLGFGTQQEARKAVAEGVRNWKVLAERKGQWKSGDDKLLPGDFVIFSWTDNPNALSHIGIIIDYAAPGYYTIEGNTKLNSNTFEGVELKQRWSHIVGAFRPDYPEDVIEDKPQPEEKQSNSPENSFESSSSTKPNNPIPAEDSLYGKQCVLKKPVDSQGTFLAPWVLDTKFYIYEDSDKTCVITTKPQWVAHEQDENYKIVPTARVMKDNIEIM